MNNQLQQLLDALVKTDGASAHLVNAVHRSIKQGRDDFECRDDIRDLAKELTNYRKMLRDISIAIPWHTVKWEEVPTATPTDGPITVPEMIPDELHHYFGRALRIIHACARAGVRIENEESPDAFVADVADLCHQDKADRLYEDYPRDWENVL